MLESGSCHGRLYNGKNPILTDRSYSRADSQAVEAPGGGKVQGNVKFGW